MKLRKPVGFDGVSDSVVREVLWVDGIGERLIGGNAQWAGMAECRPQGGAVIQDEARRSRDQGPWKIQGSFHLILEVIQCHERGAVR